MKLIIFDMDGTLINSGNVITNTINHVRNKFGLPNLESELMLKNLNNPDINSAMFFYNTKTFTTVQTRLFTKYYDEHCVKDIFLYTGIEALLKDLSLTYKLSIATNASLDFATKMLEHLDILKYFSYVVGADMVEKAKPNSDMLVKTLEYYELSSNDAIIVGDSIKDEMAASNINMKSILVNWGFTKFDDKLSVNNVDELKEQIKRIKRIKG